MLLDTKDTKMHDTQTLFLTHKSSAKESQWVNNHILLTYIWKVNNQSLLPISISSNTSKIRVVLLHEK